MFRSLNNRDGVGLWLARVATLVILAPALSTAAETSASAVVVGESGSPTAWSGSAQITQFEKPCRQDRKARGKRANWCSGKASMQMHVSKQRKVTSRLAARFGKLVSSDGITLNDAYQTMRSGGRAVKYRTFWQKGITPSGLGVLYQEKHEGMAFYNGDDVWVAAANGSDDGYHRCGVRQNERGFDVTVTDCSENVKYMPDGSKYIQFWDYFTVAPLYKIVIPTHFDMHVNIHESGYVSFWWFDEKGCESC